MAVERRQMAPQIVEFEDLVKTTQEVVCAVTQQRNGATPPACASGPRVRKGRSALAMRQRGSEPATVQT